MRKCPLEYRHQQMWQNVEYCFHCNKKIWISFDERVTNAYNEVITEKMKQDFIKLIREWKTIWEAKADSKLPEHKWTTLFTWKILFERERIIRYLDLWEWKIYT